MSSASSFAVGIISPSRLALAKENQFDTVLRDKIIQRIAGGNPCIRYFFFFRGSARECESQSKYLHCFVSIIFHCSVILDGWQIANVAKLL